MGLLLRPMLRLMLMPTTEATMATASVTVLAMAMVDTDLAMDMEDMVDTVLDSMERERLSLVTITDMERGGATMDTEPGDTTMARGRLMPSLVTIMDITRDMGMDTGPEDTTTARERPSLDMVTDTDTRDTGTMAMDTVSPMDKKAES